MGKSIKAVPEVSDEVIVGFINEDSRVLIEFWGGSGIIVCITTITIFPLIVFPSILVSQFQNYYFLHCLIASNVTLNAMKTEIRRSYYALHLAIILSSMIFFYFIAVKSLNLLAVNWQFNFGFQ